MSIIIKYLPLLVLLSSCAIDDGDSERIFEKNPLEDSFLLNEQWSLISVIPSEEFDLNGNDIVEEDTFLEIDECERDNFYRFNKESNKVILNPGNLICNDEEELILDYKLYKNNQILELNSLIGFNEQRKLNNIIFYNEIKDKSKKQIVGYFDFEFNGKKINILYNLSN